MNTQTGNRQTSVPITGWHNESDTDIDLTLYHNSWGPAGPGMPNKWRTSYDITVNYNPSGSYPAYAIVTWGDGTSYAYETYNGGSFSLPVGCYSTLTENFSGSTAVGWTIHTPDQHTYQFGASGSLQSISDRNGNTTTVTQSPSGSLASVTDSSGRSCQIKWRPGFGVGSITAPDGSLWTLTRDANDNLTGITYPALSSQLYTRTFAYDASFDILQETDLLGHNYLFTYSGDQCTSFADPLNNKASYAYLANSTTLTIPTGGVYTFAYSNGTYSGLTDPLGYSDHTGYDSNLDKTFYTNRNGNSTSFTWDSNGNLNYYTDPISSPNFTWDFSYDSLNDVSQASGVLGTGVNYTRDSKGNVQLFTDYGNNVSGSYTRNSFGNPLSITKGSGQMAMSYDGYGDAVTVTVDGCRSYTQSFDIMSRNVGTTDYLGNQTNIIRDEWGRVSSMQTQTGNVSFNYDLEGRVTATCDQLNHWTNYSYDAAGRLLSKTNALNNIEQYEYNTDGLLVGVVNARGYTRSYTLSARGDLSVEYLPDGTTNQYSYDGEGNCTLWTKTSGRQVAYSYNALDELTGVTYPTSPSVSFVYDKAGRLISMSDASGSSSLTYGSTGYVSNYSTPAGSVSKSVNGSSFLTTSLTAVPSTGSATTTNYNYDSYGRVTSIASTAQSLSASVSYDSFGRMSGMTYGNGAQVSYSYNSLGRLSHISQELNGATTYSESDVYDAVGNLAGKTVNGVTISYGYDEVNELTGETWSSGYSAAYAYDANGNRSTSTLGNAAWTYSYDPGDKLQSVKNASGASVRSYSYDADGRPTVLYNSAGTCPATFDDEDRLQSYTSSAGTTGYTYNGLGARVATNTGFSYLRYGVDATAYVLDDGFNGYVPGLGWTPNRAASSANYQLEDFIGSDVAESPAGAGGASGSRQWDAFGNVLQSSGTSSSTNGFASVSGYQEAAQGLKLVGHRFYDPVVGSFLTRDPARSGRNWFTYCGNRPNNLLDPSGQMFSSVDANPQSAALAAACYAEINGREGQDLEVLGDAGMTQFERLMAWLQGLVNNADLEEFDDQMTPQAQGIAKHRLVQFFGRQQGNLGFIEKSFEGGESKPYGTPGSIRIDGVLTSNGENIAVVDFKFGKAVLTALRAARIRANLPEFMKDLPIVGLSPLGDPTIFDAPMLQDPVQ